MKIERLSENQIRCTLNKADLTEKQLKISELAYGTPKAKELFKDMMQQASVELGFEADDTPLMIEAIPVSPDCLILIVTKVEDPEELDTRFSKFSPYKKTKQDTLHFDGADNIIDIFQKLYEETQKAASQGASSSNKQVKESGASRTSRSTEASESVSNTRKVSVNLIRLYTFHTLDDVIAAAHGLDGFYKGINTLYKDENSLYQLIVHQSSCTAEEFNKVCNILSEYGTQQTYTPAAGAFMKEHYQVILKNHALQTLAEL